MLRSADADIVASLTVMVNELVPGWVGMPLILPVAASRLRPLGSLPVETRHFSEPEPIAAASGCEYVRPTVPPGSDLVVTARVRAAIVIFTDSVADAAVGSELSVTRAVNVAVPFEVGVPVMAPDALRRSPPGSDPDVLVQV